MSEANTLAASPRSIIGKANRRLAAVGRVPAVLYGSGREPQALSLDRHEVELFLAHHAAGSTLVDLAVEGDKKPVTAMIREVHHSPVKGNVLHIDFLEVSMNKPVHATVALHLVNDPEGVRAGGVLTVNVHEINIEAKPGDLPQVIEFDVTALQMGETLHLSDIVVPKGVAIIDDLETIVASVQAPRVEVETEAGAEMAEPEVIGKSESAEE